MSKSYDGFMGKAATPYVVSIFPPGFESGVDTANAAYCETPAQVLGLVRAEAGEPTPDEIVSLLSCWAGEGVTIHGTEFSVER